MGVDVRAAVCGLILLPLAGTAQSPPAGRANAAAAGKPAIKFEAASIRSSAHTWDPWLQRLVEGDRFLVRQATMADLIGYAYSVDAANVQGGPSWLDYDRFDIDAQIAPGAGTDDQKPMMQGLLADRFHLAVHNGTAPMPAYVLRVEKDKLKLKATDETEHSSCDPQPPPAGSPPQLDYVCHNETMAQLAQLLRNSHGGGYLNEPVVDGTDLKGGFDFELKWTPSGGRDRAGAAAVSVFDAIAGQLGLKLALETAPRPVLVVDAVSETPSPDPPGTAMALPPLPPVDFEVAVVKPYKPGEPHHGSLGGGMLNVHGLTLRDLITLAWDLNDENKNVIANEPPWLATDRWDVEAKMSSDDAEAAAGKPQQVDYEQIKQMMRTLLADRFGLKAHMEDRMGDAYDLVAANPRLTAADPTSRTRCAEGAGPDGKDPRMANPILNRLVSCRNMTMAQFGEQLQTLADGFIYSSIVDKTGLKGGYDFTLSFSSANNFWAGHGSPGSGSAADTTDSIPSDPNGAISIFDALRRQLGLKLEKIRRPIPVLVIDHIDESPTPN